MSHWRLRLGALLLGCLCAGSLFAQEITGDIRGIVKDASGALVAGATVEVTNTDRNTTIRTVTTDTNGNYVAAYLPVGHYKVSVKKEGFKAAETNNVVLNVHDRLTVDETLQVGSSGQTVTVNENPSQVNLDNATAQGVITGNQVRQLTLVTRNYEQLVAALPGVSTNLASDQLFVGVSNPVGTSNQINFSINGTRPTQNNWQIDGSDNVDRGANLTLLAYPSVDSIQEFNVLRSNYMPEQGRSSGGQVNVITRSGTSAFHGSAYEFFRNDVLNANNFFNNRADVERPAMRWNDFGFTIGGPIYIPGHYNTEKNKTFFFYSQEWRKIITYNTFTSGVLPTSANLGGDFGSTICVALNPDGTCAALGNHVSTISPTAQAYINDIYSKFPAPNNADGTLTWVGRNQFNYREENVRVDHNFSSKFSIFGRYLDDQIPTQEPGGLFTGLAVPGVAVTNTNAPGRNASIHATIAFSPTTLADMGYAYSYGAVISSPAGTMASANSPDVNPTLPFGLGPLLPGIGFFNSTQGLAGFGPYNDYNYNHNAFATLTKVIGKHSLKFGGTFNYYTKDENVNGYGLQSGSYTFADCVDSSATVTSPYPCSDTGSTDQEWANFLNGNVSSFNQTNIDFRALVHQHQWEFFGQDEWRLTPYFTLSYGVRYSLFQAPTYGNGLLTTFDPSKFDSTNTPAIDSNGLYAAVPSAPYTNGILIGGKDSPYGDAVNRTPKLNFAPRLGFAWDPTHTGTTSIRGGFGLFFDSPAVNSMEQFQPGNPPFVTSTSISNTNFDNPGSVQAAPNLSPPDIGGIAPNWKQPYTMMWSLDVQHQFTPSTIFDIGYYGNAGRHLIGVVDVNQAPLGGFQALGIPGPVSSGDTQKLNQIRPYQGYASIDLFSPVFTSSYNGLQTSFTKHFTENSMIVLNYTWSHALGTASSDYRAPQYSMDIGAEYGNLDYDRRNMFTANYVYDLPFFKHQQGVAGHVLGGWEVSGLFYAYSGAHYTASASRDPGGLGLRDPNTFEGGRPDLIGNPQQGAPNHLDKWFNTSAFALVPAGDVRVGNEPRGVIVGPGYFRWDASLFKNIKFTERLNLQFRAEAFNVLNHTNFNAPNVSATSSLFGQILSARDPRQLQLALKLTF
ncbi:TonB-dependent receptor [Candidatus Koribacter versatilis Ellin345]|uniref:TonB-dependent receptor n=1 Tax=Koribacter versatilis (strain Ellin345) TaxID=204669 RepID=Q1IPR3_KORVE|nr:carboxypeptidase-like regulatory domain-containing protein [Candidatus Koribacter versatilis]ABF41137.1 TonB-dependent receptor [Candidatus Koribacter versatilis Ellin345]